MQQSSRTGIKHNRTLGLQSPFKGRSWVVLRPYQETSPTTLETSNDPSTANNQETTSNQVTSQEAVQQPLELPKTTPPLENL